MKYLTAGIILCALPLMTSACGNAEETKGFYKGNETPQYTVIQTHGDVEIRQYDPTIVARVKVDGTRKEAVGKGFRLLAGYIFGGNEEKQDVKMTSPVVQSRELPDEKGTKIDMTSPVTQSPDGDDWVVEFTMPRKYNLNTLPKPENDRVQLTRKEGKKIAALRYSGWWSESNYQQAKSQLETAIKEHKIRTTGEIGSMYYDDPFTLPWNRRNEVMIEVK